MFIKYDSTLTYRDSKLSEILTKVKERLDNKTIIEIVKKINGYNYTGIIRNSGSLEDIKKQRQFISPSSVFGYIYAKNTASIWNLRPKKNFDLFITDNYGILKNGYDNNDTKDVIKKSRSEKEKIVYFFGGSTAVSVGCNLPEYSITAQIEKILKLKYNINCKCINLGFVGFSSMYYLNILKSTIKRFGKPDAVVTYGGWNECYHYTEIEAIKIIDKKNKFPTSLVNIYQHTYHHDFILQNIYNTKFFLLHAIKLLLSEFAILITKIIRINYLKRIVNYVLDKLISIRIPSFPDQHLLNKLIDFLSNDKNLKDMTSKAAVRYIKDLDVLDNFCKNKNIDTLNFFQPTVYWGNKKLTDEETVYKNKGYADSSRIKNVPLKFKIFYDTFRENREIDSVYDISNSFDDVTENIYSDIGHVNRFGNFLVSIKIAEIMSKKLK